jgi:hypothetical protein
MTCDTTTWNAKTAGANCIMDVNGVKDSPSSTGKEFWGRRRCCFEAAKAPYLQTVMIRILLSFLKHVL